MARLDHAPATDRDSVPHSRAHRLARRDGSPHLLLERGRHRKSHATLESNWRPAAAPRQNGPASPCPHTCSRTWDHDAGGSCWVASAGIRRRQSAARLRARPQVLAANRHGEAEGRPDRSPRVGSRMTGESPIVRQLQAEAAANPDAFWARAADELPWFRGQAGPRVRERAGRTAELQLRRADRSRQANRGGPPRDRHPTGGSHHALHAHVSGGDHADARIRANRGDPLRGLRGIWVRRTRGSHRCQRLPLRVHGRRRVPEGSGHPAQGNRGRGARYARDHRRTRRRPAPRDDCDPMERGTRPRLVGIPDGRDGPR